MSEIVQRADLDAHSQTWQQIETLKDADGNNVFRTNLAFIQVETGMHYREKEQWKQTQELIEPFAGGAVASHGPHKVIFAENLNTAGAIDMETPDAKRLRSHVLGLAYVDTTSGKSVFIAEIKDCRGEIINSNQVIYSDAFKGVKADVRYTYTKSGFEQDIILRSQPPSPKDFGFDPETVRLQIYTEFLAPPKPDTQTVKFQDSRGEEATDELLDFGDMKIGVGRAFSLGEETKAGMPVAKKWVNEGGRSFLVEELAFTDVSAELEALPKGASISRPNKSSRMAKWDRRLPRTPKAASTRGKMLMAKFDSTKPGLVMDYVMLNGNLQNYTFKGDTTYYISGNVILLNTTTIEGGTVVKYAQGKYIQLSSSVVCKTGPYRPAIFTARDDDTVGEILTGISTGTPSGYYASTALSAPSSSSPVLSYLRISYATQGLYYNYIYGSSPTLSNVQFVNCQVGIATYNCPGVKVRNGLFKNVITAFSMYSGYSSGIPDAQHITVDGCTWLWATSHPYGQGIFKNCIFANVSGLINQSGGASVGGANNGFYNAPSFGSSPITFNSPDPSPFQTVGAGTCYLAASSSSGSAFINAGNAPIDTALVAQLKLKTTTAPQSVFDNQTIGTVTTWSQTVTRDMDTPDLGYHYEPLDVCVSRATLGGTLTVSSGTAVGYFGLYGFRTGTLSIQGTPLNRNKLVHYSAVQEQPVPGTPWGANAASCYLLKSSEMPTTSWKFSDVSAAGGAWFGGGQAQNMDINNCELYAARLTCDSGSIATMGFTNNILQRCSLAYGMCSGVGYNVKFANNLFLNSSLTASYFCYPGFASSVTAHNNLFANSIFTWTGWGIPQNSFNGYCNSTVTSQGTSPVSVSTLDFQTGALGAYYYPTAINGQNLATLVNAGSTSANTFGLCPFTTRTDQSPEGTSQVDIGFHYVALDAQGNPKDNNGNGIPDFDETPVANPQTLQTCRNKDLPLTLSGLGLDCGALTFSIVMGPTHGQLVNVVLPNLTYRPSPGFCGPDSFTFKVKSNGKESSPETVNITVGNPNPTANCQDVMTGKDIPITFALTGTDSCNDILTFVKDSDPASGTISQFNANTGSVTYQPDPGFEGTDLFTFHVNNCGFSSGSQTVTINVVPGPTLTTGCRPNSIILTWTLPPFLQMLAASGYIQDFRVFRCSVTSGSCTPPATPLVTISDPLITRDPLQWSFVDTSVTSGQTFCYAITFTHKNICDNVTVFESPRSTVACATTCCPNSQEPFWTDMGPTPQQMAEAIMAGTGITVVNGSGTFTGATVARGFFGNGFNAALPINGGVILSSGSIKLAEGNNNLSGATLNNSPAAGDPDLNGLVSGLQTLDAAVLEFDVVSSAPTTLAFQYMFASEEYPEFVGSLFNDIMGIFVDGNNIARVPVAGTPPVGVNSVNGGRASLNVPATNPAFYVDNHDPNESSLPPFAAPSPVFLFQYDGATALLTAQTTISMNTTHHVKIAVADATDRALDSAVFISSQIPCP